MAEENKSGGNKSLPVQTGGPLPVEGPVTGRGVFAVREVTVDNKKMVAVEAGFLAESGDLVQLPALFVDKDYALEQIDQLRVLVEKQFAELAKKPA